MRGRRTPVLAGPTFDASPLWRDVPLNMKDVDAVRGLFEDFELGAVGRILQEVPTLVVMGRHH